MRTVATLFASVALFTHVALAEEPAERPPGSGTWEGSGEAVAGLAGTCSQNMYKDQYDYHHYKIPVKKYKYWRYDDTLHDKDLNTYSRAELRKMSRDEKITHKWACNCAEMCHTENENGVGMDVKSWMVKVGKKGRWACTCFTVHRNKHGDGWDGTKNIAPKHNVGTDRRILFVASGDLFRPEEGYGSAGYHSNAWVDAIDDLFPFA